MLVVLAVKLWPWESQKVQDEKDSWEAPRNPLYILRGMRDRVFMRYVGVHQDGSSE